MVRPPKRWPARRETSSSIVKLTAFRPHFTGRGPRNHRVGSQSLLELPSIGLLLCVGLHDEPSLEIPTCITGWVTAYCVLSRQNLRLNVAISAPLSSEHERQCSVLLGPWTCGCGLELNSSVKVHCHADDLGRQHPRKFTRGVCLQQDWARASLHCFRLRTELISVASGSTTPAAHVALALDQGHTSTSATQL